MAADRCDRRAARLVVVRARSVHRQVFFPLAGAKEGWARLARNRKAEIDPDLIEAYHGTVSLPFEPSRSWTTGASKV